jgi:hypothetical protein
LSVARAHRFADTNFFCPLLRQKRGKSVQSDTRNQNRQSGKFFGDGGYLRFVLVHPPELIVNEPIIKTKIGEDSFPFGF